GRVDRRARGERMVREQGVEPDIDAEPGPQCQHQERDDGVYRQSVEERYRHRYCGAGEWGELDGQAVHRGVMRHPHGAYPRAKDYGTRIADVPVACIATKKAPHVRMGSEPVIRRCRLDVRITLKRGRRADIGPWL